ncbi:MAG TPA: hypothetical protein VER33_08070 [Polyangiaceae bacterium]|nr:hypothetical protein [Polyangiaceae bacterium]
MRSVRLWSDLRKWRWLPAVGLVLAALIYVMLALLLIPDRIGQASDAPATAAP